MHPMLNTAVKAARDAAEIIQYGARNLDRLTVESKAPGDFVSEIDRNAEAAIVDTLLGAYPNHGIIAEEGSGTTRGNPNASHIWIIDPLDGTTNFLHGFPTYCVSIALQVEGKLTQAHATLEDARELLAGLRHRNQVVTYSDHMNAYHAQMEHVLESGAKLLTEPQGSLKLLAQASVMDYLAQRLRSEAPAALLADAEFNVTLQNVEASMAALKAAAMAQDAAAIKDALPKLKPAYSKHFIKFG